jgi:formamidopyrimidine-DNA glycosylase
MAELPEAEVITQELKKTIIGKKIKRIEEICPENLRRKSSIGLNKILNKKITNIKRRGKYIIISFSKGYTLLIHLGMTGHLFYKQERESIKRHDLLIFDFFSEKKRLIYNDIRRFGSVTVVDSAEIQKLNIFNKMGPEPLKVTKEKFLKIFRDRKSKIKSLLLNQNILAGLGNIYADEALFQAKIHPEERANTLSEKKLEMLRGSIKRILVRAIQKGGSTIMNYCNLFGEEGKYQNYHKVYGKGGLPCSICRTTIKKLRISQRSSFYCPKCQKKG